MLPLALDFRVLPVAVVGPGPNAAKRLAMLDAAGARHVTVYAPEPAPELTAAAGTRLVRRLPEEAEIALVRVLFIADLDHETCPDGMPVNERLAAQARASGVLVNVEDVNPLCDFHVPALVRRGDLVLTVSTGGRSPAVARAVRRFLETAFPEAWADRLKEIGDMRLAWKREGLAAKEITARTDAMLREKGWMP